MATNLDDLQYYASVLCQILERPADSMVYIDKIIDLNPALTNDQYTLFSAVYKSFIDPIRKSLYPLMQYYNSEVDQGHALKSECIQVEKEKLHNEFQKTCNHVIDLIINKLLPQAIDQRAKIFYEKMLGDYYRYLSEFENREDAKKSMEKVEKAYLQALNDCNLNLLPCDPLRLSLVLNYAIFKHDHLKQDAEANELLRKAKIAAEPELGALSQQSHDEALELLETMHKNIVCWSDNEDE